MAIGSFLKFLFGSSSNPVKETIEVFRPNAEANAQRVADYKTAALHQYAAEFHSRTNRTWIDSVADGLNRLIRPIVTLLMLYPLYATVQNPELMARVWTALATLPDGYWAVAGIVLSFYFGGRMQMKALNSSTMGAAAQALTALSSDDEIVDESTDSNPALDNWRKHKGEKE